MKRIIGKSLVFTVALGGCLPYGSAKDPKPPLELPATFDRRTKDEAPPARVRSGRKGWWKTFDDPTLDALLDKALRDNLELGVAYARIERAEALADQTAAARYPQVNLQGQVSRARSINPFFGATFSTIASASAPVSYEVDWFARWAGETEAARIDAKASRADLEAAAMSIAARVTETYFNILEARARHRLLDEQLEINETFLELVTLRFRQGLTSAVDIHQQRQQVAATRAQIELVVAQERVLENQLAALLGEVPQGNVRSGERTSLPDLDTAPPDAVPADLLTSRPDVRAAAERVKASDERVAASIAARLPSLVISASPGYRWLRNELAGDRPPGTGGAVPVSQEASGFEWNTGATLTFPLFDGFQRRSVIRARRAQLDEAIELYAQTLQTALVEVQNALAQEEQQRKNIEAVGEQVTAAEATLEAARDRYRQGLTDFLPVLTGLQTLQQSQIALLSARRQLLSYRVQLHRALGGAWTSELPSPSSRNRSR